MTDYLEFDCTPYSETCAQVGWEYYNTVGMIEANVLLTQLKEQFGEFRAKIASCPHDFGYYYEIRVEESELAYEIDNNFPGYWTEESKLELDKMCLNLLDMTYTDYMKNFSHLVCTHDN